MVSFCHSIYIEDLSKTSLRPRDISRTSSAKIRQMVIKLHDWTPAALMTLSDTESKFLQGKQANKTFIFAERSHKQEGYVVYLGGGGGEGAFMRIPTPQQSGIMKVPVIWIWNIYRGPTAAVNELWGKISALFWWLLWCSRVLACSGRFLLPPTKFSHTVRAFPF